MNKFEELLKTNGPVALTIREYLEPVQGAGSVLFPATFAPPEDKKDDKPSYVVDEIDFRDAESNQHRMARTALVDSVGSQANRIEPIFKREPYKSLIPWVTVTVEDRVVNLLDAGHRAADAIFRFSNHEGRFKTAFEAIRDRGDSWELAKIAPTTMVFGGWDSRGTKVKLPRIVGSVIRAWDVNELSRAAQFFSAFEKEETEQWGESKALSAEGLLDSPSGRGPGGIIANGGVVREATLNLIVVRSLVSDTTEKTARLQEYVLGLALIALMAPAELFLREGCLLVQSEKGSECRLVQRDGKREKIPIDEAGALAFAQAAAEKFGVGDGVEAKFESERIKVASAARKAASDARAAKKPKTVRK